MLRQIRNQILKHGQNKPAVSLDICWDDSQQGQVPLTIFIHGYKGFKNWGAFDLMAEAFAKAGLPFLKFNFSHNGTTPECPVDFVDLEAFGKNTLTLELADLHLVLNTVENGAFEELNQFIVSKSYHAIGFSRGGANAIIQASSDPRIVKLVTWNSIDDFTWRWQNLEMMEEWKQKRVRFETNSRTHQQMPVYYSLVEDYFAHFSEYNVIDRAKLVKQPWLLVHARNDEAVSFSAAENLLQAQPKAKLFVVENTGHTFDVGHPYSKTGFPEPFEQAIDATIQFLKS